MQVAARPEPLDASHLDGERRRSRDEPSPSFFDRGVATIPPCRLYHLTTKDHLYNNQGLWSAQLLSCVCGSRRSERGSSRPGAPRLARRTERGLSRAGAGVNDDRLARNEAGRAPHHEDQHLAERRTGSWKVSGTTRRRPGSGRSSHRRDVRYRPRGSGLSLGLVAFGSRCQARPTA